MAEKERTASRDRTGAVLLFGFQGTEKREPTPHRKNSLPYISREKAKIPTEKTCSVNSSLTEERSERRG